MADETTINEAELENALSDPTATAADPPTEVANDNVKSDNADENGGPGTPTVRASIYASGNAGNADTGVKKSNASVSHACDKSTYVGMAAAQIGGFGGQVVKAVRDAVKAVMAYFGANPAGAGITSQLKKLAQEIKDAAKFIQKIANAINQYTQLLNKIKQLLNYLLTLPQKLLVYFADCIRSIKQQIASSFTAALADTGDVSSTSTDDLKKAYNEVQASLKQATAAVKNVATAAVTATVTTASIAATAAVAYKGYSQIKIKKP